jgi:hypothetical protein
MVGGAVAHPAATPEPHVEICAGWLGNRQFNRDGAA